MSGRRWSRLLRAALDADGRAAVPAAGAVANLRVASGEALARVTAASGRTHRVSLILPVLEPPQWDTVAAALGGQPLFRARLLDGHLPVEVARVFDVLGLALLPRGSAELVATCSCPEWKEVCGHVSAVLEALVERVDADPFVLVAWRGGERGALLAAVRAHAAADRPPGADAAPPVRAAAPLLPDDPGEFWRAPAPPAPPTAAEPPPPPADGPLAALAPLYERLRRA